MAQVVTDDTNYKMIADEIRLATGETEKYLPSEMWLGVLRVQAKGLMDGEEVGRELGREEGLAEGIEQGKQAESRRMWNRYQQEGKRKYYNYAFSYAWNDEIYDPIYPFTGMVQCLYMFYYSGITDTKVDIDISGLTASSLLAYNTKLHTVKKLIVSETTTGLGGAFTSCTALQHMRIEGTLATSANFGDCPLDAESLVSVVEHFSNTATGLTLTVKQTAVNNADWSKTNYASWDELKAIRPNLAFAYK